MVDYSKWDNLDSDSDSGSANAAVAKRKQASTSTPSADEKLMQEAEVLRYGVCAFALSVVSRESKGGMCLVL